MIKHTVLAKTISQQRIILFLLLYITIDSDDGDYEGWKYCTRRIIGDWVIARMPLVTQNDHDDNHDGDINDDHYDVPCDLWCNNDEEEKEEVMSYSP